MTSPETRLVRYLPISGPISVPGPLEDVIKQQPIPWCTAHDQAVRTNDEVCWIIEWRRVRNRIGALGDVPPLADPEDCLISTGGPDHKWWRDQ